jgi:hypothetical protein
VASHTENQTSSTLGNEDKILGWEKKVHKYREIQDAAKSPFLHPMAPVTFHARVF